ncbi:hypothetical protein F5Y17DRAFT_473943 [Xylariaceae sp. FL0594]|nr:hypothetical protein F5Y17DRAFT_473943 [Xylariaceae sp. FL0594]
MPDKKSKKSQRQRSPTPARRQRRNSHIAESVYDEPGPSQRPSREERRQERRQQRQREQEEKLGQDDEYLEWEKEYRAEQARKLAQQQEEEYQERIRGGPMPQAPMPGPIPLRPYLPRTRGGSRPPVSLPPEFQYTTGRGGRGGRKEAETHGRSRSGIHCSSRAPQPPAPPPRAPSPPAFAPRVPSPPPAVADWSQTSGGGGGGNEAQNQGGVEQDPVHQNPVVDPDPPYHQEGVQNQCQEAGQEEEVHEPQLPRRRPSNRNLGTSNREDDHHYQADTESHRDCTCKSLAGMFETLAGTFKTLAGTFKTLAGTFKTLAGTFKTLEGTFKTLAVVQIVRDKEPHPEQQLVRDTAPPGSEGQCQSEPNLSPDKDLLPDPEQVRDIDLNPEPRLAMDTDTYTDMGDGTES